MIVKYNITVKDLITFQKKVLKENSIFYKNYIFIVAFILALAFSYYNPPKIGNEITYEISMFSVSVLLNTAINVGIVLLIRYFPIYKIRTFIHENPGLIGEREMEINDDNLIVRYPYQTTEIQLITLKKVQEYNDYYYIYINGHKEASLIIPKRAIGSDALIDQLKRIVK
jgi:hypothetical protein